MSSTREAARTEAAPRMVITPKMSVSYTTEGFRRHVSRALLAAGLIFLMATALDLGLLWLQRQPGAQSELAALAGTADGLSGGVLALALLYAALHIGGSTSLLAYRLLALGAIAVALAGAAAGGLMLTDFGVLRPEVGPEGLWAFRSTVLRTLVLCGLCAFVMLPAGVLGLGRPRR